MSFLSSACQTCKSRHLKCDEGRPACQRCIKSRRNCHRSEPIIHNENSFASRQRKRPRGPRTGSVAEALHPLSTMAQMPSLDINMIAFSYYLRKHLLAVNDLPRLMTSQSEDVVRLWTPKINEPLLELSISAMALAVFSRIHNHPKAAIKASSQYQKLLSTARTRMNFIDTMNVDIALLAIFFMGRYEDSMHPPELVEQPRNFASALRSVPHHEGAVAMLKIWKDQLSLQQQPSEVIRHSRQGMIRSAIMRNRPIPDWMTDGSLFGERGLELEYDRIMVRLANVRFQFSMIRNLSGKTIDVNGEQDSMRCRLINEACDIDMALQQWVNHFPSVWRPHRRRVADEHSEHISEPFVYYHTNPVYAAIWNRYYATRMLVNSSCIDMLQTSEHVDPSTDVECITCLSRLELAADDLSASIPCVLQGFTHGDNTGRIEGQNLVETRETVNPEPYAAGMVVWPLTIASSVRYLDPVRKHWFRSELRAIGGLLGNRVFEAVQHNQWLEL